MIVSKDSSEIDIERNTRSVFTSPYSVQFFTDIYAKTIKHLVFYGPPQVPGRLAAGSAGTVAAVFCTLHP